MTTKWLGVADSKWQATDCGGLAHFVLNSYNSYKPQPTTHNPPHGHVLVCIIHSCHHDYSYLPTLFATFKRNTWPKGLQANDLIPCARYYRWRCDLCKSWRQQTKEAGARAGVFWCLGQVRNFSNFVRVIRVDWLADREEEELYAKYLICAIFQTCLCLTFTSTASENLWPRRKKQTRQNTDDGARHDPQRVLHTDRHVIIELSVNLSAVGMGVCDDHLVSTLVVLVLEPRRCLSMESAKPSPLRPLSLNSAGPRLLQLCSSPSPASPSAAATSPSRPSHLKRASTISYSPRSPSAHVPQSPARNCPPSSGSSFSQSRRASLRAARRTSYDPSLTLESTLSSPLTSPPITAEYPAEEPLTLAERYVGRAGCYYHPPIITHASPDDLSLCAV